jgi:drug/metabolite transporter (DMT)-like permease
MAIESREQRVGIGMVLIAVCCFSTAPIFVLAANRNFSPIEIAFWRVLIGAAFVGMLGYVARVDFRLHGREWQRFWLYGFALALHLSTYVAALSFTSIAHAVALTYTSPIWIALLGAIFLHERPTLGTIAGLAVAIAGIVILSGFQPDYGRCEVASGHCSVLGDGLALIAAICAAIYSMAGRVERESHPLFRYTFYVYGFAALWLAPVAIVLATRHSYTIPAVGAVVALGLVPLGMGHTLYNAALRYTNPTLVNLISTQEITGGIILGMVIYHQVPEITSVVGVIVTLVGIVIVMLNPVRVIAPATATLSQS